MNLGRDPISNINNRIRQIEQNFNPQAKPQQSFQEAFNNLQAQTTTRIDAPQAGMMNMGMPGMMNTGMPGMMNTGMPGMMNMGMPGMMGTPNVSMINFMNNPYVGSMGSPMSPTVKPLAQSNGVSCGQTSVAMCINSITGKNLNDMDINSKYGFQLLNALNSETASSGVNWRDGGEVSPYSWNLIDKKVNQEGMPVIVALNGPEFSPSGRGHIVTVVKTQGDTVYFADPATGEVRTTTKQAMNNAPKHPDGNFIFFPTRGMPSNQFMAQA